MGRNSKLLPLYIYVHYEQLTVCGLGGRVKDRSGVHTWSANFQNNSANEVMFEKLIYE